MAREDERIMEKFVNRGTGELAGRDLQRANAPQLGNALTESQIIRSREDKARQQTNLIKEMANRAKAPRAQAPQGGGAGGGTGDFVLKSSAYARDYLGGKSGGLAWGAAGNPHALEIVGRNPEGPATVYNFSSTDELRDFLKKNPNIERNLVASESDPLQKAAEISRSGGADLVFNKFLEGLGKINQDSVRSILESGRGSGGGSFRAPITAKEKLTLAKELNDELKAQKAKAIDPFTSVKARWLRGFN